MSGTVQKHRSEWSAYLAGIGFVGAAAVLLWMLLKDWASLITR